MKDTYCIKCIATTPHTSEVDGNGEFVFTCSACGHFIKVAPVADALELQANLDDYESVNKPVAEAGQLIAAQQAILEEVVANNTQVVVNEVVVDEPVQP